MIKTNEAKQACVKVIVVPVAAIAIIIGAKGATVRDIQDKTLVKFDFDRTSNKCSLKGRFVQKFIGLLLVIHVNLLFPLPVYVVFSTCSYEGVDKAKTP